MRRRRALALLLAAGMLCSECSTGAISSNYRPVEDLELIQTIGVDLVPEGVCLSAATGKAGEDEAPKRMTQAGVSMLSALDQLQDRTPSAELFYAQTSYLLLGEEAAAAGGLTPLLDFIARDPDMRLSAPLFIVRGGTAQQAVMETGDDKTDVTEALAALEKDITLDGARATPSPARTSPAPSPAAAAPQWAPWNVCARRRRKAGKLALAPAGYAIFRNGSYAGSIEPETARGASMLLGAAGHGNLAVTDGDGGTVMLTLDTCKGGLSPGVGQRRRACARGRHAETARGHRRTARAAPDHGTGLSGGAQRGACRAGDRLGRGCDCRITDAGRGLSRRGAGARHRLRAQMGCHPR